MAKATKNEVATQGKNELTFQQRFTNKVTDLFQTQSGEKVALTDFQKRLAQNYCIEVDNVLKKAEARRLAKDEKWREKLPYTWANVAMEELAIDVVAAARVGLDPAQKNHVNLIPFKDSALDKYRVTFIDGYRGIELKAVKYAIDPPDAVTVEVIHKNDKFRQIKKDRNNPIDTYEFEIVSPFDRGDIVGGFYYHQYEDNPSKNKLVVMTLEDILKRKPDRASVEFWGGEKDVWEKDEKTGRNKKVGKEKVDGWYKEMVYKGLALDTKMPTPHGWTTMADVEVGSKLFDVEGKICTVTGVSEIKNIDCYEVEFSNGEKIICDDEHRWLAERGGNARANVDRRGWGVYTVNELFKFKQEGKGVVIPLAAPIEMPEANLLIDPWLLGYWIGNGSKIHSTISCSIDCCDEIVSKIKKTKYQVGAVRRDSRSKAVTISVKGLITDIKALGLYGNKHIPVQYLRASVDQRLELLSGLIDSDGSVTKERGRVKFFSTQKHIAEQTFELASSLGECVSMSVHPASGFGITTTVYIVSWLPVLCPASLNHHVIKLRDRNLCAYRSIKSIRKVDTVSTKCVSVDSETHTYLAGYFTPTHNTIVRAAYGNITIDSQKIDDDYMRLKTVEKQFIEAEVEQEIAENANTVELDFDDKDVIESKAEVVEDGQDGVIEADDELPDFLKGEQIEIAE